MSATSSITTSFGYDAAGNKTRYTDGDRNNWIPHTTRGSLPEYESSPPLRTYTTAADSTFTTAYDADGRAVTYTEPGGATISYGYDSEGNLQPANRGRVRTRRPRRAASPTTPRGTCSRRRTTAAGSAAATSETFTYNDRGEMLTGERDRGEHDEDL